MAKTPRSEGQHLLRSVQYKLGLEEGKKQAYGKILGELEKVIVKDTTLKRDSPEYQFALRLTQRLGALVRADSGE